MKILIADDYQIVRRGIRQILLEEYGFALIDEVGDAESAMDKINRNKYDLVICDLSMPGKSGLDVLHHIKQHVPEVPVLIISIHPDIQYAVRALKAGAAGYLNKDAAVQELSNAVKTILSGKKYGIDEIGKQLKNKLGGNKGNVAHVSLSNREFEILKLIASGKTISEIAGLISLRIPTVNTYRRRILRKLNLRNNPELTRYALDHKLI